MAGQTLAELKAANAAAAKPADKTQDPPPADESADPPADPPAGDTPSLDPPDDKADDTPDPDKADTGENTEWLKEETPTSSADSDAAKIRRATAAKFQGRLAKKDDELKAKEDEIAALKKKLETPAPAQQPLATEPKREQFKTDPEYQRALAKFFYDQQQAEGRTAQAVAERQNQQAAYTQQINEATTAHYERAKTLAEKSKITPEAYQQADLEVREAVESVFPKGGDAITDNLIANIGAGSEKVMYYLGRNASKRDELVKLLKADRSGLRAAVWLGTLNAKLTEPVKRESRAPDPPENIQGDKQGGNKDGGKLKRDYDEAHRKGDINKAISIKRAAKARGVDTSRWA